MRVTNSMIASQVIGNLARSLERFMNMQAQMSTGRRINKPSDDPVGTHKDLRYRTTLNETEQFQSNVLHSITLQNTYESTITEMVNSISEANGLALSLSNDTFDAAARIGAAEEARSILSQMILMANSQFEGRYIFSGHKTQTAALKQYPHGIVYQGDTGRTRIEIESRAKVDVNLLASEVLFEELSILGENGDLMPGIDDSTLLADLHLGTGVDQVPGTFTLTDINRGEDLVIDLSGAVTVGDVITTINNEIMAAGWTNISVDYGAEGGNLRWVASDENSITVNTPLASLNGGDGVDLEPGSIRFHSQDYSFDVYVDISGATTVGDVIDAINNDADLAAQGISAQLSIWSNGALMLTNSGAEDIVVENGDGSSSTAEDLGLAGTVNAGDLLGGQDLYPKAAFEAKETATDETTITDLGLAGEFSDILIGDPLTPVLTLDTPLTLLDGGQGFELGRIQIYQGQREVILDLGDPSCSTVGDLIDLFNNCGLDIEASINEAQTGIQIVPTINTETLIIDNVGEDDTAFRMGIKGSPHLLGNVMQLIDDLETNDRDGIENTIGNFQTGIDRLLVHRASVGARVIRMEMADKRLIDVNYNFTSLLSQVEDADLTKLLSDLAVQENSYQAAMISAAKIIQPSLVDFLR